MQFKNKRGISIMIGYILLITLAVIMSLLVYQWIKTYIPKDAVKCPDGVSVFIQEADYVCTVDGKSQSLEIVLKNNGKFNVAGYFIHVTDKLEQELATIDISGNITVGGTGTDGVVMFVTDPLDTNEPNPMPPEELKNIRTSTFDFILKNPAPLQKFYKVEIIPVRYQEEDNKFRFVSCSSARVSEALTC